MSRKKKVNDEVLQMISKCARREIGESEAARKANVGHTTMEQWAKQASRNFRKAVSSQLASHFVFTAMTLISAALLHRMNPYRDDDKELTAESVSLEFAEQFAKNVFNAIVPVFGNYAVSAFEKIVGANNYDVLSDAVVDKVNGTIDTFAKVTNINYFVRRDKPYNPIGRMHTEKEAQKIENSMYVLLERFHIDYKLLQGNQQGYDIVVNDVLHILKKNK